VSSVTVTDSKWNGSLFLHSDMMFEFFSDVRVEVASINVDFTIRVVILLGQRVEKFFYLTFVRAHIHACDVDWACYEGRANCPRHGLVSGTICPVCDTVLLNFQVVIVSVQNCNTTPMLVLFTSSFLDSCHSPYIPSAVNRFFRAEGR